MRTAGAALLVGLSRAVMEYAIPYAKDRHAFGEAIAQKQAVAFMLSDMQIEVNSMRWLVWKAAATLESLEDATKPAIFASRYAAEQAMKIAGQRPSRSSAATASSASTRWSSGTAPPAPLTVLDGVAAV